MKTLLDVMTPQFIAAVKPVVDEKMMHRHAVDAAYKAGVPFSQWQWYPNASKTPGITKVAAYNW